MSAIREFTKLPEKRRVNCCQAKRYSHCFEACRYLAYNALLDGLIKAAGKISTGGRIRNPMRSQTIQESFIIAAQLDIFQTLAIQEGIVSQIQHVITLVIREMPLEQLQPTIDLLGQS